MNPSTNTGYVPGGGGSSGLPVGGGAFEGMEHDKLRKQYLGYLDGKSEEIREQQNARRYYHGSQWTAKQINTFNRRKQPVVTFNRIGRKINAIVGLLAKQRQDPQGFPRTSNHEQGAELATAVLRYVMDNNNWATIDPICGLSGAVDGIGGVELTIEPGNADDPNDRDIGIVDVEASGFFYDPRSVKADFSDARYMGVGKWADLETVIEMFPDREDEIRASVTDGGDLTSDPDSDVKWTDGAEGNRRVRLVDHWYIWKGEWHYCVYTGSVKLLEGVSPFVDEHDRPICKFIMFSANVDHDGDRYGWVRGMKSSQDEINQRRSKGLHLLNSRRVSVEDGEGLNIERIRTEAAKPDGVLVHPPGTKPPNFDDAARGAELSGQLAFLADAKGEIENYGFNPALMGTGVQDMSGRAIQLQQAAGIAELGPYLISYKGWKLRVYRALWNAVRVHWTAERMIHVTDDEGLAQFFKVNEIGIDPRTGQPAILNALGRLDVDIIIDEGPDTVNMQADAYDTLSVMARGGQKVPMELLIELSPLQGRVKKKAAAIIQKAQQAEMQQRMPVMQAEMMGKQAETANTAASAKLRQAQTVKTMAEAQSLGADAQSRAQDLELEKWERMRQQAREDADAAVDELMAAYKLEGQQLTNAGKELDLAAKAQPPAPGPTAAPLF